jgi:hypothetical protein
MHLLAPYKFSILRLRFAHWLLSKSHVAASRKLEFSPLLAASYMGSVDIHYNLASPVL